MSPEDAAIAKHRYEKMGLQVKLLDSIGTYKHVELDKPKVYKGSKWN